MSSMISGKGTVHRAMGLRAAAFVMLLAMIAGCSSGDTAATPSSSSSSVSSASATIDSNGGTLTGPGGVQVVIPKGALSQPTVIAITRNPPGAPAPLQEGNAPAGSIYEFTPHDLVFNKPVTIRMPILPGAATSEVFMASLGGDWMVNNATPNGAFAEWQRNSFSFGLAGLDCAIPIGGIPDPYPCSYPSGGATVTGPVTQIAPGWLNFGSGSAGSWSVNPPGGTVSVTLNYRAALDCAVAGVAAPSGRVKLIRWNPAVPLNTPGRVTTLFDQSVGMPQVQVAPPLGTFEYTGGGPVFHGEGSTTVNVSSSLGDATNVFGFSFSCQRPGHLVHTGGDLITIIGPMAAPVGPFTIGGSVSGLTGTVVLQNNGGNNQTVTAPSSSFSFTPIVAGANYGVSVLTQPIGQTCSVTQNASGLNVQTDITTVGVSCITNGGLALVANGGGGVGNTLSIYRADANTGALTPTVPSTISTGTNPYRVVITPNGSFAYVTNLVGNSVSSYSIDSTTGVLSLIPLSSPGTNNPFGIAMDPLGRFIWVANYSANTVSAFAINATTGVLAAAGAPVSAGGHPYALAVNPNGTFVYVVNETGNSVSAYSVNSGTGALTFLSVTSANSVATPHGIAIDPTGKFVYVANTNSVASFAINVNGTLATPTYANTGGSADSVVVHPTQPFVYASNKDTAGTIAVFKITSGTGALTMVGSPAATGKAPGSLAINTAGTVLYVTNQGAPSGVSAFSIDLGTGGLTSLGAVVGAGSGPEGIALTP